MYCQDQRGILIATSVTCTDPSNPNLNNGAYENNLPISTPVPTPLPTLPPFSGDTLPNTGFADDYLMWSNWNGAPSCWNTPLTNVAYSGYTPLQVLSMWQCTAARLSFTFPEDPGVVGRASDPNHKNWGASSTYDYSKMNTVLNYLNSVGAQAILCDWSSNGVNNAGSEWLGSQAWVNDWVNLATAFKGDTRIKAFQLDSEPWSQYWSPTGPTGGCTDYPNPQTFDAAMKYCIDQIHAVDPTRIIIYPDVVGIFADTPDQINTWLSDLDSKGITSYSYVMYDINHPYYFGDPNYDGSYYGNPSGDADYQWNSWCLPQINHFGVAKCWSGEMFCWTRYDPALGFYGMGIAGNYPISYNDQQTFVTKMINYYVSAGIGFQMLQFIVNTDSYAQVDALTNSNYYKLIH